jgi:hypothetical protein
VCCPRCRCTASSFRALCFVLRFILTDRRVCRCLTEISSGALAVTLHSTSHQPPLCSAARCRLSSDRLLNHTPASSGLEQQNRNCPLAPSRRPSAEAARQFFFSPRPAVPATLSPPLGRRLPICLPPSLHSNQLPQHLQPASCSLPPLGLSARCRLRLKIVWALDLHLSLVLRVKRRSSQTNLSNSATDTLISTPISPPPGRRRATPRSPPSAQLWALNSPRASLRSSRIDCPSQSPTRLHKASFFLVDLTCAAHPACAAHPRISTRHHRRSNLGFVE